MQQQTHIIFAIIRDVLTSEVSTPNKVNVCEMLRPSESEISTDHNAIIFDLNKKCIPLSRVTRTVFDYGRADFASGKESLMMTILTTNGQTGKIHSLRR